MSKVVLFSGGVDSLTSVLKLKKLTVDEFKCLYVDFGHRYKEAERNVVFELGWNLGLDVEFLDFRGIGKFEKPDAEIPFRNDFLIMIAMMLDARDVFLSIEQGTEDNVSRDRSQEFMDRIGSYLSWRVGDGVYVHNLVAEMTKQDEMKWILDNYGNRGRMLLLKTFSCYNPVRAVGGIYKMCGNCKACLRWYLAGLGVGGERDDWASNPVESIVFQEYVKDTKAGVYKGRRGKQYEEIFKRLGKW